MVGRIITADFPLNNFFTEEAPTEAPGAAEEHPLTQPAVMEITDQTTLTITLLLPRDLAPFSNTIRLPYRTSIKITDDREFSSYLLMKQRTPC